MGQTKVEKPKNSEMDDLIPQELLNEINALKEQVKQLNQERKEKVKVKVDKKDFYYTFLINLSVNRTLNKQGVYESSLSEKETTVPTNQIGRFLFQKCIIEKLEVSCVKGKCKNKFNELIKQINKKLASKEVSNSIKDFININVSEILK